MIRDLPQADDLLEIALDTLRARIIPLLSEQSRHTGLMIANALAISLRDIRGTTDRVGMAAAILEGSGEETAECLCAGIDRGDFDAAGSDAKLRQALLHLTRQRLSISNPKFL